MRFFVVMQQRNRVLLSGEVCVITKDHRPIFVTYELIDIRLMGCQSILATNTNVHGHQQWGGPFVAQERKIRV